MSKIKREFFDKALNKLLSLEEDVKNMEFTSYQWGDECDDMQSYIRIYAYGEPRDRSAYDISFFVENKGLKIWLANDTKIYHFNLRIITYLKWEQINNNHDHGTGRCRNDTILTDNQLSGLDVERIYETLNYFGVLED